MSRRSFLDNPDIQYDVTNPFVYESYLKLRDDNAPHVQYLLLPLLYILAIVLVPIRLICAGIFAIICALLASVVSLFSLDLSKPLHTLQRGLLLFCGRPLARLVLLSLGYVIVVKGNVDHVAPVVLCNHTTMLDILAMVSAEQPSFVAKASSYKNWLLFPLLNITRCILVRYSDDKVHRSGTQQMRDRIEYNNAIIEKMKAYRNVSSRMLRRLRNKLWPRILIFPEGTVKRHDCVLRLRTSAFRLGAPLQIATIQYSSLTNIGWVDEVAFKSLLRCFLNPFGVITVTYHPTIYPSEADIRNPRKFADRVGSKMASYLGASYLPYTNSDAFHYFGMRIQANLSPEFVRDFGADFMSVYARSHRSTTPASPDVSTTSEHEDSAIFVHPGDQADQAPVHVDV